MTDSAPYSVPREPGRWRAMVLAAVVHAALLALLWFGVSWQNDTPVAVEAEVWSPQAREAAPKPLPEPEPQPAVQPPPRPAPREVAKPTPPPESAEDRDAQIALEQQKKRKQQQVRREQEREQELKQKQATEQARADKLQQQKAALKAEQKAEQKAELKAEQKREELQKAQQQADALAKQKTAAAAEQKKLNADKQRTDLLESQKLAASREDQLAQMRRLAGSASPVTGSGGNGDAAKSQGARADASYIDKVRAKIKSNTIFNGADQLSGNPPVEFAVELLPDGSTRRIRKIKASGVPGFDEAVERAIEKSQPYPSDKSGSAPASFTVSYKPKDQ
ncbi:MAG: cell envelope integrity protein TolA [Herminiimonas sp.]|nr:cell envelope integrity protein TolA [Herminiimonas sp.]